MTTTEIMNNTQQSHKRLSTTQNPHVKFCGMTREQDIELAVELGVNAVGMILVPGTARGISPQLARQLNSAIPEHVISVVVVRNQSVDEVRHIIDEVQPDVIQFHGDELPEFCQQFNVPYWKSIAVQDKASTQQIALEHHSARALVFDSWSPAGSGGHGVGFDWALLPPVSSKVQAQPYVLSGGLSPDSVALTGTLVQHNRIDMLDVSTGIEPIGGPKGIKSSERMQAFMGAVYELRSNINA